MLKKLEKVFGTKSKFKGQGHRLGSTEERAAPERSIPIQSAPNSVQAQPYEDSKASRGPASPDFQARPLANRATSKHPSAHQAKLQQQTSSIASVKEHKPAASSAVNPANLDLASSSTALHQPQQLSSGFTLLDRETAVSIAQEDLQAALALLDSSPAESKDVLKKLFANILQNPSQSKYRRIRLGNPKIQAAIVDADGGLEMLQACGFHVVLEDTTDSAAEDAFAVFPDEGRLEQMTAALTLLGYKQPETHAAASSRGELRNAGPRKEQEDASLTKPCARNTQVVLPSNSAGGSGVADWVFKRTPAELKAAMIAAQKKREQSEMLMTRATREKMAAGGRPATVHRTSLVRVRLPEGLLLQASFNALEPVAAIFNWVTDCLAQPDTLYELVLPDRKPLVTGMGTVKSAGLLPSVLLNFRSDSRTPLHSLTLKEEVMATAAKA